MNRLYEFDHIILYIMGEYQAQRTYLLAHFQDYRIVQPNVVFVHGLSEVLSDSKTLKRQISKYGNIIRINLQKVGKDFYSAFVEFQHQIDAAFLIVILDCYQLRNRALRVFYGSTKFCPHYLKGHLCRLADCNYAHYYHPFLTHQKDQAKDIDHLQIATAHIVQWQQQLPDKLNKLLSQMQRKQDLLPLQKEKVLQFLTKLGYMHKVQGDSCLAAGPLMQNQKTLHESEVETEGESLAENNRESTQQQLEWSIINRDIAGNNKIDKSAGESVSTDFCYSSRVQQFLDGAERFLTKLIFHSSESVY